MTELLTFPFSGVTAAESQSGLFAANPYLVGALSGPARGKFAAIVMHPTSSFLNHYLLEPLAQRGISLLALNSRFTNNDSTLRMERVIEDVAVGMRWLRERFDTVVLLGNSGGGALMTYYQAMAEAQAERSRPGADGVALLAAHLGRSRLMARMIDGSLTDESDPLSVNPALDIYNTANGPPFSAEFLDVYRQAQTERLERITLRTEARIARLAALEPPLDDEAFVVYRTYADPRFIDLTLDANDRALGGNRAGRGGGARSVNFAVSSLGRYTSLSGWLSQWSPRSNADGPSNLARTSVPVLNLEYTADGSIFPSDIRVWSSACVGRETRARILGGTHYLQGQPQLVAEVADHIAAWCDGIAKKAAH